MADCSLQLLCPAALGTAVSTSGSKVCSKGQKSEEHLPGQG